MSNDFLQLLVELFRCGIILNMYGFEVLYLITIHISIYSYMTCIKVLHMMITRIQIHVRSRVWKNLCLPFLETRIYCECVPSNVYTARFGWIPRWPLAMSSSTLAPTVQFTVKYRQMSDSRDL